MNAIADRYRDQGVGSIFLYTHEAHPGEKYPHLTSIEQKFRHARDLQNRLRNSADPPGLPGWNLPPGVWIYAEHELDFHS